MCAGQKAEAPGSAVDVLGEFLKGINTLSSGKKVLPSGDPFLEKIRTKYEIPERIQIIAPRGGSSVIAFIFDNEQLPVMKGSWTEIFPSEYKYLQTYHNLKFVYCLHDREPVDLGDIIIAVKPEDTGEMSVYFNDKQSTLGSARIYAGNAVMFSRSRYIVKPVKPGF